MGYLRDQNCGVMREAPNRQRDQRAYLPEFRRVWSALHPNDELLWKFEETVGVVTARQYGLSPLRARTPYGGRAPLCTPMHCSAHVTHVLALPHRYVDHTQHKCTRLYHGSLSLKAKLFFNVPRDLAVLGV